MYDQHYPGKNEQSIEWRKLLTCCTGSLYSEERKEKS